MDAALIPARGDSKGIPKKNLRKIGGIPLVQRAVGAAIDANVPCWVDSDDQHILLAGLAAGAQVYRRPDWLGTDDATTDAVALDWLIETGNDIDILVVLQCTAPFLRAKYIIRAVECLKNSEYNSCIAMQREHTPIWACNPELTPVWPLRRIHTRQERDTGCILRESGMLFAVKGDKFLMTGSLFTPPWTYIEIDNDDACDIDVWSDLRYAQWKAKRRQNR